MKNEKGITLVALAVTIIIMVALVGVGIKYGGNSYSEVQLQNFSYELQQVQGRVDTTCQKMSMEDEPNYILLNGEELGVDMKECPATAVETLKKVKGIDYSSDSSSNSALYFTQKIGTVNNVDVERKYSYYRYFSREELSKTLDIKNPKQDVIINFKTREVISVNRTGI